MILSGNRVWAVMVLGVCCLLLVRGGGVSQAADPQALEHGESQLVSIDFNDVDINVFIKFISKLTGKNFVVDNRVRGKVTIISPTRITVKEAYRVFESVLEINGFSTVTSGQVVKIIPMPNAKGDNIDTRVIDDRLIRDDPDDRIVTRIIPLEYAGAEELRKLFLPLVPKGSVLLSYADTNMLIVTATHASISRLMRIVEEIDVKSTGRQISVIPVTYADAQKLVQSVSAVFSARARGVKAQPGQDLDVVFVADERTNAIILLASIFETQRVRELVGILDQKIARGGEKIRVYYMEHASAEDLVKVLQEIPAMEGRQPQAPGQTSAPLLSGSVKVMADKATNSLIIMAEKEDYPILEDVIGKLDIPRSMVYIESLIMEVNVARGLEIGTEWRSFQTFDNNEKLGFIGFRDARDASLTQGVGEGRLPQGFSLGVVGKNITIGGVTFPDLTAVVRAYQTDKDVHILAHPQVLTMENEEASITVGKNVPFQTRSAADVGTEVYSSFEYRDVGITLKITPQISKDRLVKLQVNQELTKLDTVNQTSPDRPTTFKRQIETTIIVEDGNSVVIGGLIDESLTNSENKTPCLGDLPGLGWAFKTVSRGQDKTNLYVFLTPRVVKNPMELNRIYTEKKQEMDLIREGEVPLYKDLLIDKNRPVQDPPGDEPAETGTPPGDESAETRETVPE
jgi:general secretion pathway protein D